MRGSRNLCKGGGMGGGVQVSVELYKQLGLHSKLHHLMLQNNRLL